MGPRVVREIPVSVLDLMRMNGNDPDTCFGPAMSSTDPVVAAASTVPAGPVAPADPVVAAASTVPAGPVASTVPAGPVASDESAASTVPAVPVASDESAASTVPAVPVASDESAASTVPAVTSAGLANSTDPAVPAVPAGSVTSAVDASGFAVPAMPQKRKLSPQTLSNIAELTALSGDQRETAAFETAAFETAAFETAAFETAAFETAVFETATSETAASETAASETAASETTALVPAAFVPEPMLTPEVFMALMMTMNQTFHNAATSNQTAATSNQKSLSLLTNGLSVMQSTFLKKFECVDSKLDCVDGKLDNLALELEAGNKTVTSIQFNVTALDNKVNDLVFNNSSSPYTALVNSDPCARQVFAFLLQHAVQTLGQTSATVMRWSSDSTDIATGKTPITVCIFLPLMLEQMNKICSITSEQLKMVLLQLRSRLVSNEQAKDIADRLPCKEYVRANNQKNNTFILDAKVLYEAFNQYVLYVQHNGIEHASFSQASRGTPLTFTKTTYASNISLTETKENKIVMTKPCYGIPFWQECLFGQWSTFYDYFVLIAPLLVRIGFLDQDEVDAALENQEEYFLWGTNMQPSSTPIITFEEARNTYVVPKKKQSPKAAAAAALRREAAQEAAADKKEAAAKDKRKRKRKQDKKEAKKRQRKEEEQQRQQESASDEATDPEDIPVHNTDDDEPEEQEEQEEQQEQEEQAEQEEPEEPEEPEEQEEQEQTEQESDSDEEPRFSQRQLRSNTEKSLKSMGDVNSSADSKRPRKKF
jgi:hypothetical protein